MMQNEEDNASVGSHRVLLNELVLQNMFDFVDFETLRNCRAVCTKWNSVCDKSFKKRAKVIIRQIRNYSHRLEDVPVFDCFNEFKNLFFRDESEFSYSSFGMVGHLKWNISELQDFFANEGRFITELTVKDLALVDDDLQPLTNVDVATLITPNLKRLIIRNHFPCTSLLNTAALASLDYLYLRGCEITLMKNFKISPKELIIFSTFTTRFIFNKYFYEDGTEIGDDNTVSLWEFLNLQRLEKLTIGDNKFSLDLMGTKSLESLSLNYKTNGRITNLEKSEWQVNKLKLEGFTFYGRSRMRMTVTELEVRGSKVDFAIFPTTIEKLKLEQCRILDRADNIAFPLLKYLVLRKNGSMDFPSCFKNCNSISEVAIDSHVIQRKSTLNVDYLPNNVNKLFFNQQFQISGTRKNQLDILVLVDYPPEDMDGRELSQLPAKHLIYLNIRYPFKFKDNYVRKIFQISKDGLCENVTVGPFKWDRASKANFAKSSLCQYVGESEFYTFQAKHMKSIGGFLVRENIKNLLPEKISREPL